VLENRHKVKLQRELEEKKKAYRGEIMNKLDEQGEKIEKIVEKLDNLLTR
jgi:hypothetical protein